MARALTRLQLPLRGVDARRLVVAAMLAVAVLAGAALVVRTLRRRARAAEFVSREGDHLVLHGRPFRFVGANVGIVHGPLERSEAARVLDVVAADGVRVVRVWALGETDGAEPWRDDFAVRRGPHGWIESTARHLDGLIAEAAARHLRVIVVLANRWGDFGGFPQYLRWAGVRPRGEGLRASELRRIYTDESVSFAYQDHVRRLVTRRNSVTGVPWRDDPTILAWELVNESEALTCESGDRLVEWVDRHARFVHALDANHLVGAGVFGYWSAQGRAIWTRVHALESIDYADHHAYFDDSALVVAPEDLPAWIAERAAVARDTLHKPLVFGEFGFTRTAFPGDERARWFRAFLEAANVAGVSGAAVWVYQPWRELDGIHGIFGWGPRAAESDRVRTVLRDAAPRWASTVNAAVLRAPTRVPELHDEEPEFVQASWSRGPRGATLVMDPWGLSEACAEAPVGWSEFAFGGPGVTTSEVALSLDTTLRGPFGITVSIDDRPVGTLDEAGDVLQASVPFDEDRSLHWLRFATRSARGRALLARWGTELPSLDRITLAAR